MTGRPPCYICGEPRAAAATLTCRECDLILSTCDGPYSDDPEVARFEMGCDVHAALVAVQPSSRDTERRQDVISRWRRDDGSFVCLRVSLSRDRQEHRPAVWRLTDHEVTTPGAAALTDREMERLENGV